DELRGDRVQVDDAVDAVVAFLQVDELADRAEIVAEMEIAGRLDAGEDERLEACHERGPGLVEGLVERGVERVWLMADRVSLFKWRHLRLPGCLCASPAPQRTHQLVAVDGA